MKCSEVSPLLSEYVDDLLAPATRKLVEEHVATCEDCAAELGSLKAYLEAMAGMEKVSAPPDFLAAVHERIEQASLLKTKSQELRAKSQPVDERIEQASAFNRLKRWLFYPLRIKLPMELAGIALAALLLVFAYQTPKHEETKSVPAISSGVGQTVLPAAEKEAALDKAAVTEPVSAPRRIALALLLSPPQTAEHAPRLQSQSAAPSSERKLEPDRRKAREQIAGQPAPPMESAPQAPTNAAKKGEPLTPVDSHQAAALIEESAASLGGMVVSTESRTETNEPATIIVRIPARNYSRFLERLRPAGNLKETREEIAQTMATAADHELLEVQIKLIPP